MYTLHKTCRACGYAARGATNIKSGDPQNLIPVFDLGLQPLANDFKDETMTHSGYAPLKVLYCPKCSLAQLSVTVDPAILYKDYPYVTSSSKMMEEHFERLVDDIESETSGRRVLEIGSNDGRLLVYMKNRGFDVYGVDPADNLAKVASSHGVHTYVGLFGEAVADELMQYMKPFPVVVARHVFCHIDNWTEFMAALDKVTTPDALICIETPYLENMLAGVEFDTIYHEHLSYLPISAMEALVGRTGFRLHHIIHYPIHGGAMLFMISKKDAVLPISHGIPTDSIGLEDWSAFSKIAHSQIESLRNIVRQLTGERKTVAGLGASAKSTVWINACGFTRRDIRFISDNTLQKQYRFSPGNDIPILDEGAILRELPDFVVMWAWNYREEILKKFELARSKGVKFIIPVPTIEVV